MAASMATISRPRRPVGTLFKQHGGQDLLGIDGAAVADYQGGALAILRTQGILRGLCDHGWVVCYQAS